MIHLGIGVGGAVAQASLVEPGEPHTSAANRIALVRHDHGQLAEPAAATLVRLPHELSYLGEGDVVALNSRASSVHVLYRRGANANALLVTERCNSYCTMCSQPPKDQDDTFLADQALQAIRLIDPDANEIGITGGEPTLLGHRFFELVEAARDHLPTTGLHVLTNGRLFAYLERAKRLAGIDHPDLMLGIPLYSDLPWRHDFVVQARGAFDQTVRGMMNLARVGVPVEMRVVIHRDTYERLPQLARFVARNLPFVHHVALMGLELTGHTPMNLEALWSDPIDYQQELSEAVETLLRGGVTPRIYNHQLCTLDQSLWPYAVQSISDWKNTYVEACTQCSVRHRCAGFFASSALRHSRAIRPLSVVEVGQRSDSD